MPIKFVWIDLNVFKGGARKVVPTIGVSRPQVVEEFHFAYKIYDMGGNPGFREAWFNKMKTSHAVFFVIDASDSSKILEARDEFEKYIAHNGKLLSGKPIAILLNKEDSAVVSYGEIISLLNLKDPATLSQSPVRIFHHSISPEYHDASGKDPRVMDAVRWVASEVSKSWTELSSDVAKETKVQDAREREKIKEAKKSIALKKKIRLKNSKLSATVAPLKEVEKAAKVPETIFCSKMFVVGNDRVQCIKEATVKNKDTNWRPVCAECFESSNIEANIQVNPEIKDAVGSSGIEDNARREKKENSQPKKEHRKKKKKSKHHKEETIETVPVRLQVGERVEANYHSKGVWYSGKVRTVHTDGSLDIDYDDGDKETHVNPCIVTPIENHVVDIGTKVQVRLRGKHSFFSGKIQSYHEATGLYKVLFEDGDEDKKVKREWILIAIN